MQKVAILQTIHPSGIKLLKSQNVEVVEFPHPSRDTVANVISQVDGIIVRTFPISAELIGGCPSLRVIGRYGVGVDNVDIPKATEQRIPVVYAPVANTQTVAEHALALMLGLAKQLVNTDTSLRKGDWAIRDKNVSIDLEGKALGLIGLGQIGSAVARMALTAFGMTVLAYDPFISYGKPPVQGISFTESLDELLKGSDFVSIHVPSTKQTEHMIGREELAMMKSSAFLINTSRGNIIDEEALALALRQRQIAGAGLDVFETEPPKPNHPLFQLPNVIVTPHMAGMTRESVVRISTTVAQGVLDVLQGRRPQYVFNPEVYEK